MGLLQRYLEDQLMLAGSVYDCGEDDEVEADDSVGGGVDSRTPLLS